MLLIVQTKRRMNRSKTKIETTIVSRSLESWLLVFSLLRTLPSPFFSPDLGFPYVNKGARLRQWARLVCLLCVPSPFFGNSIPIFPGESPTPHFYSVGLGGPCLASTVGKGAWLGQSEHHISPAIAIGSGMGTCKSK